MPQFKHGPPRPPSVVNTIQHAILAMRLHRHQHEVIVQEEKREQPYYYCLITQGFTHKSIGRHSIFLPYWMHDDLPTLPLLPKSATLIPINEESPLWAKTSAIDKARKRLACSDVVLCVSCRADNHYLLRDFNNHVIFWNFVAN